ncbi:MAG: TRAP transporter large permease [Prochlorothrix sp.]
MTGLALGLLSFPLLLVLIALGIPIALAMLSVGAGGYILVNGWDALLNYLKTAPYYQFSTYSLSVIPLFLLMGQFATAAGISKALFQTANTWLGHRRGGIALAAIGACAAFGAICGSSLATAATLGKVALPEMRRFNYQGSLATGVLAAGGTLGILIPPSMVLVIYSILTEQNIAKLFTAALIPGILAALGYMGTVAVVVRLWPGSGPGGERLPYRERLRSLGQVWPVVMTFGLVMGGIYSGWFTPTEGAAVGALSTGAIALGYSRIGWRQFCQCLQEAAVTTGMIFLILLGAELYNAFLAQTQMPMLVAQGIAESGLAPRVVLGVMLLLYLVLGCVMDSLSMILLTVPIFFPVIMGLDFGLSPEETGLWFGILALIVVEVGLITPPVGMNVFVINQLAEEVSIVESFKGVFPFLVSDGLRVLLLVAFPSLTLSLVRWLY